MNINRLTDSQVDFDKKLQALLNRSSEPAPDLIATVQSILDDVRSRGDAALVEYTNQFDQREVCITDIEITVASLEEALNEIDDDLRQALEISVERIREFHERQKQDSWQYTDKDGNTLGQQITPLERVGVYVPGGKAAYPSSARRRFCSSMRCIASTSRNKTHFFPT